MRSLLLTVLVALPSLAEEPKLAPNAPVDKPVSTNTTNETNKMDAAIAPFVAEARKTWPAAKKRYLAGLPKGEIFFVTVRIYEGGVFEQSFVRVTSIKNGVITGTVANQITRLKKVKEGDSYSAKEADIYDWLIAKPDGSEEGNVVGKFLDTYRP